VSLLILLLIVFAGLLVVGVVYQALGSWRDARRFPAPGRMVDVGSCRLHLNEQGSGRPVVVLEAGIAASSISWSHVQPRVAEFTTACSYDRAGLGWSERRRDGSRSVSLEQMIGDLDALLRNGGLDAALVLVGHSFGGLLVRAFAHAYPERVAGLVLVDPVSVAYWCSGREADAARIRAGMRLSRRGAVLARIGLVRAALSALQAGGRWLPRGVATVVAKQGTGVMDSLAREIGKLPPEMHSTVRAHWSRVKGFLSMAEYLEALPACAEAAQAMDVPAKIPVTILSAGNATPEELTERDAWAAQSDHGVHIKVAGTGHWVQLERPDLVVAAVREIVEGWADTPR
jgi:pimeloyl-ACP methyl ester carboxylesterase